MEKEKKNKQLIAYIREGKEFTVKQKILLVLYLSVPTILAQISSIIMQYIDAAMVGHLGTVESSAIGLMATSTWLFGSLCTAGVAGFSIQLMQDFLSSLRSILGRKMTGRQGRFYGSLILCVCSLPQFLR